MVTAWLMSPAVRRAGRVRAGRLRPHGLADNHALAGDAGAALAAIEGARAAARARVWGLAGKDAPRHGATAAAPLVIDLDATLVTAHSEKENARPTFKRGFGFHPLWAFADHGPTGTGEPLAVLLRAGNAGRTPPRTTSR